MSRIKGKNTKPELRLRSLLHRVGFRFRLHDHKLPGKPDLVLRRYKTAIFVNGCYWHRHEGCPEATMPKTRIDFWQAKFQRTVERDKRNYKQLEQDGWHVLTVWECELKSSPDTVLRKFKKTIRGYE